MQKQTLQQLRVAYARAVRLTQLYPDEVSVQRAATAAKESLDTATVLASLTRTLDQAESLSPASRQVIADAIDARRPMVVAA